MMVNSGAISRNWLRSMMHLNPKVFVVLTVDIVKGDCPGDVFHVVLGSLTQGVVHVHLSASEAWLTLECGMAHVACLSPF
jgi:hypothetical protein